VHDTLRDGQPCYFIRRKTSPWMIRSAILRTAEKEGERERERNLLTESSTSYSSRIFNVV
jgi:hypothetical protein